MPHARLSTALLVGLLAACATQPPEAPAQDAALLRLSPASAGREIALAQHLVLERNGQRQELDAQLEVDAGSVRLALLQFGQPVARLVWDGVRLSEQRAPGVPASLSAARILSEMQLVQWPADAIRAALPAGWQLREAEGGALRELLQGDRPVLRVRYRGPQSAELEHLRDGYRLRIESTPAGGS